MATQVEIRLIGEDDLQKRFSRLTENRQMAIMRQELQKSGTRLKKKMIAKLGTFNRDSTPDSAKVHSVRLADAMRHAKVVRSKLSKTRGRGFISTVILPPTRAAYGLPADYEWYPPWSLEFGYTRTARNPVVVPAYSYIRSTVNEHGQAELNKINRGLAKKIEKSFATGKGVR